MPIVIAPTNRELKIVKIIADEKTKKHLESLGIVINGEITVLAAAGSVICKIKDGRSQVFSAFLALSFINFI